MPVSGMNVSRRASIRAGALGLGGGLGLAELASLQAAGGGAKLQGREKTGLWWLVGDELQSMAILPSGGDNSYPGFATIDDQHGVVSWYSSHEKDETGKVITAIYVADLEVQIKTTDPGKSAR